MNIMTPTFLPTPNLARCSLYTPLLLVIPAGGITIPCPVHPEGHFLRGQEITC